MSEPVDFRFMMSGEEEAVCKLVKGVFEEFVAPDFDQDGIDEFFRYSNAQALAERCAPGAFVLVAARGEHLVGMIEITDFKHIAMLFVALRGQGVATELVHRAVAICKENNPGVSQISVHSSLFAERIYRRLGFESTGDARTEHGITYVPMALQLETGS